MDFSPAALQAYFETTYGLLMAPLEPAQDEIDRESLQVVPLRFDDDFIEGQAKLSAPTGGSDLRLKAPTAQDLWACASDVAEPRVRLRVAQYMNGLEGKTLARQCGGSEFHLAGFAKGTEHSPGTPIVDHAHEALGVDHDWLWHPQVGDPLTRPFGQLPTWLRPWHKAFAESHALCCQIYRETPKARPYLWTPGGHQRALSIYLSDPMKQPPGFCPWQRKITIQGPVRSDGPQPIKSESASWIPEYYKTLFDWGEEGSYLAWFAEAAQYHFRYQQVAESFQVEASTLQTIEWIVADWSLAELARRDPPKRPRPDRTAIAKALKAVALWLEQHPKSGDHIPTPTGVDADQVLFALTGNHLGHLTVQADPNRPNRIVPKS